ncbi:hypothetical protein J6590_082000 [Homalodisca vitripennis]|nr:hypothetical protein J6590_082000 [Homalodisca vitripennis]
MHVLLTCQTGNFEHVTHVRQYVTALSVTRRMCYLRVKLETLNMLRMQSDGTQRDTTHVLLTCQTGNFEHVTHVRQSVTALSVTRRMSSRLELYYSITDTELITFNLTPAAASLSISRSSRLELYYSITDTELITFNLTPAAASLSISRSSRLELYYSITDTELITFNLTPAAASLSISRSSRLELYYSITDTELITFNLTPAAASLSISRSSRLELYYSITDTELITPKLTDAAVSQTRPCPQYRTILQLCCQQAGNFKHRTYSVYQARSRSLMRRSRYT